MAPSEESKSLVDLFIALGKYLSRSDTDTELYRLLLEELHSVSSEPTDVTYEEVRCPGTVRPAIWCKPVGASSSHVILYLHGGAFAAGSPSSLRKVAAHLAKATGCYALVIDYRRSPDHHFPSAIEDVVSAYQWLINDRGYSSANIAAVGDSAGGNLSIASSLKLRQLGLPLPAAIVGFSPWIDMTLSGKSYVTKAKYDALVTREAVAQMRDTYFGTSNVPDDPLARLLEADITGFPPMYLIAGANEVVSDDAVMLAERAEKAGVEVKLELAEGMQHIFIFMAGTAPEAIKTVNDVADWLRPKLGINSS